MDDRQQFEVARAHFAWRVTNTMDVAFKRLKDSERAIDESIDRYHDDRRFFEDIVETALSTGMSVGRIAYHLKISIDEIELIMKGNEDGKRTKK